MNKQFHKAFNFICYLICLIWGEMSIMEMLKRQYFTIFILSFLYSSFMWIQMKKVSKLIEE